MAKAMTDRITWAPRLQPRLLRRLYESDAGAYSDLDLCDEVGTVLHARCEAFHFVSNDRVCCPRCDAIFVVARTSASKCPTPSCGFATTFEDYRAAVRDHYAWPGRATQAFETFYERYPTARTYQEKIVLIDQLIHSFHIDEKRGHAVKSVASKLLEGNKKDVVRFLDELSAVDADAKDSWRRAMSGTIDRRIVAVEAVAALPRKD